MAALAERGYALSCGRLGRGTRVSVFHVKLTDSALRAFEANQGRKVRDGAPPPHPHPGEGGSRRAPNGAASLPSKPWAGGARTTPCVTCVCRGGGELWG